MRGHGDVALQRQAVALQDAGLDHRATAVAVGAGQREAATAQLAQRAVAADRAAEAGVGRSAGGQRGAGGQHHLAGIGTGLRQRLHAAAGQHRQRGTGAHADRAAGQRVGLGQRQRAAQHLGAAVEAGGRVQRQPAVAQPLEDTAATQRAAEGAAGTAAGQGEALQLHRTGSRQRPQPHVGAQRQRGAGGQVDGIGRPQRLGLLQRQAAAGQLHRAAEGRAGAGQGQQAVARLGQPPVARQGALHLQRGAGVDRQRAAGRAHHHRALRRQRHRAGDSGTQTAAVERERCRGIAQRGIGRHSQHTAGHRGATAVATAAAQRERAAALLVQGATAREAAVEAGAAGSADAQHLANGQGHRTAAAERASLLSGIDQQRAAGHHQRGIVGQGLTAQQLQHAALHLGAAPLRVGAGQGEHAAAQLQQGAVTQQAAIEAAAGQAGGQRGAGRQGGIAGAGQAADGEALLHIQLRACAQVQRIGAAQGQRMPQRQAAGLQIQRAAEAAVVTSQLQGAGALLDQCTATRQRPAHAQAVGGCHIQRAALQADLQAAAGVQHQVAGAGGGQGAAVQQQRAGGRAQLAVGADHQPALPHLGAAGLAAGSAQGQRAAALLDQAAGTAEAAAESGIGRSAQRQQGAGLQRHGAAACQRAQRFGGVDLQQAAGRQRQRRGIGQRRAVGQPQRAGGQVDRAAEAGRVARQAQAAGALLAQRAAAAEGTRHVQLPAGGLHVQRATCCPQHQAAGCGQLQRHSAGQAQAAAIERQGGTAAAQGGIGRHRQRAAGHQRAAGMAAGRRQRERARTLLAQAAGAAEAAVEGGIGRRADAQLAAAGQLHRAAAAELAQRLRAVHRQRGRAGQGQRAGIGQGPPTGGAQRAGTHVQRAGEAAVVALQLQFTGARLGQRAAAADRAGHGQRGRGGGRQHAAGRGHHHRPIGGQGQGLAAGGAQGAAIQRERGPGGAQAGIGIGQHHPAGQRGATQLAVGARQRQHTGTALDQRAATADGTAEGGIGRGVDGERVRAEGHRTGARQRAHGLAAFQVQAGAGAQLQRARIGQGRAAGQAQAAGLDRGAAGEPVAARQPQRTAAALDQAAQAVDGAGKAGVGCVVERQRVAVQRHRAGAGQRRQGLAGAQLQRGAGVDLHGRRVGQRAGVGQHQRARGHPGACRRLVAARQREAPGALLDQAAIASERAAEVGVGTTAGGQRVQAQHHVATTRQRAHGLTVEQPHRGAGVHLQRAGIVECGATRQRQHAGLHHRAADERIGARQRDAAEALLDHATIAADGTAEQCVGHATEGQRVHTQHDAAGARQRAHRLAARQAQRGTAVDLQGPAIGQRLGAGQFQRAGLHRGAAGVAVAARQGEHTAALLDQAATAIDAAAEAAGRVAAHRQRRAGQGHIAAVRQRAHGLGRTDLQRGAGGHLHRAGVVQRGTAVEHQGAACHRGATGEVIAAVQREAAAALLAQATRTGDAAAEAAAGRATGTAVGQRAAGGDHHRAVAVAGQCLHAVAGIDGQRGAGRAIERHQVAGVERAGRIQRQRAVLQVDDSGEVGAGPAQRHRAAGLLEHGARTGQAGVQLAGAHAEHVGRQAAVFDAAGGVQQECPDSVVGGAQVEGAGAVDGERTAARQRAGA